MTAGRLVKQVREAMRHDGCPVCGAMTPPCPHSMALLDLLAEARKVETLRGALAGLDGPVQWLALNYPKALREMPVALLRRFDSARAALAEGAGVDAFRRRLVLERPSVPAWAFRGRKELHGGPDALPPRRRW